MRTQRFGIRPSTVGYSWYGAKATFYDGFGRMLREYENVTVSSLRRIRRWLETAPNVGV